MSKKLLVVDDDVAILEMLTDLFENYGYSVIMVENGEKAVELVKRKFFDMILMDIQMPKMDGITTMRMIKELSPVTPVIMITACSQDRIIKEALDTGALGVIRKPFKIGEIVKMIDEYEKEKRLKQPAILIVEDDDSVRTSLKLILEEQKYKVAEATTGKEALEKLQKEFFDLVIIDYRLPDSKGTEMSVKINEYNPEIDVIVITGYADLDVAIEAIRSHVLDFIQKPLELDELLKIVKDAILKKSLKSQ